MAKCPKCGGFVHLVGIYTERNITDVAKCVNCGWQMMNPKFKTDGELREEN